MFKETPFETTMNIKGYSVANIYNLHVSCYSNASLFGLKYEMYWSE